MKDAILMEGVNPMMDISFLKPHCSWYFVNLRWEKRVLTIFLR